jgi:predicted dehydrogenase
VERRPRVGVIGLSAKRGWATAAHIPAWRALSDHLELVGVASNREVMTAALQNRKCVYCDWLLGDGLAEVLELAKLAKERKVPAIAGTQAVAIEQSAKTGRTVPVERI